MKPAIDSYCTHRFFGEWYAALQTDPIGIILDDLRCLLNAGQAIHAIHAGQS